MNSQYKRNNEDREGKKYRKQQQMGLAQKMTQKSSSLTSVTQHKKTSALSCQITVPITNPQGTSKGFISNIRQQGHLQFLCLNYTARLGQQYKKLEQKMVGRDFKIRGGEHGKSSLHAEREEKCTFYKTSLPAFTFSLHYIWGNLSFIVTYDATQKYIPVSSLGLFPINPTSVGLERPSRLSLRKAGSHFFLHF